MSLPKFQVIVAIDGNGGISKNGTIPWNNKADMKFFRETTFGSGKNVVIMGRKTYESIPPQHRPLEGRLNVVISKTWRQEDHQGVCVYPSFAEALAGIGTKRYDAIFVIGGESIYNDVVNNYLYLCDKIYVTKFKTDYDCTQFFPWEKVKSMPPFQNEFRTNDFTRYYFKPDEYHYEYQYLDLLRHVNSEGENRPDRTGTGTRSYFGARMTFDISERIPLLTTKKMPYDSVIKELLFFISGQTDTKILEDQSVNYWKGNTSKKFLEERKLKYDEGDMGPMYGFQWRHWGAEYHGCNDNYTGQGFDQIKHLVHELKENPFSRRHILSSWNVAQLDEMVLAPCHILAQFNISADRQFLDCQLYQRSGDMGLGVPTNIFMYSVLTYMIAHLCNLKPRKFIHVIGDAHIYNNHVSAIEKMLERTPRPWPRLRFKEADKIRDINQFKFEDFIIDGYTSWPYIPMTMAV